MGATVAADSVTQARMSPFQTRSRNHILAVHLYRVHGVYGDYGGDGDGHHKNGPDGCDVRAEAFSLNQDRFRRGCDGGGRRCDGVSCWK